MISIPASVQPVWADVVGRARLATGVAKLTEGSVLEIASRAFLLLDGAGSGAPNVFARALQVRMVNMLQMSLRHAGVEGATAAVENDVTVVRVPGRAVLRLDWAGDSGRPEIVA